MPWVGGGRRGYPPPDDSLPTGIVRVELDGQTCTASVAADGTAVCAVKTTAAGTRTVSAEYVGEAIYSMSKTTTSAVVGQAATDTVLTSLPNPSRAGQLVTFS